MKCNDEIMVGHHAIVAKKAVRKETRKEKNGRDSTCILHKIMSDVETTNEKKKNSMKQLMEARKK